MKTAFAKSSICLLLVAATLAFVGCGPKISRCVLSGTVTTDGEPVPVGTVLFIPENPDPKLQVAGSSADIVDGKYQLSPETGLVPGKYKVQVISLVDRNKKTGEIVNADDVKDGLVNPLDLVHEDLVPPKFGSATEQYVEVGKGKTMTYDIPMVKE